MVLPGVGAELFELLPALQQAAGHVEAAFPLAALQGEEHFAPAVEVAVPFGVVGVDEVAPDVAVYAFEPVEAAGVAGEAVAFEHSDEGLDVYPPEFLVPFELLAGVSQPVHKVEYASVLLVPAVFGFVEGYAGGPLYQVGAAEAFAEVHNEPHSFDGVAGIELPAVEAVDELAVGAEVFDDEAELGLVEHVHHFVYAVFDGLLKEGGREQRLYLQRDVAEYHGQGKRLQRAGAGGCLVPAAFGTVELGEHDVEGAAGDVGVFLATGGQGELSEGDDGEGVGEDVVGLYQGVPFAVEGEVPVELAVVPVALQKLGTLYGAVEPFLPLLHLAVEGGEHPYFAALQPDEFVGVEHVALAVEAGEVAAVLLVLRLLQPEGDYLVEQLAAVLGCQLFEIVLHSGCVDGIF